MKASELIKELEAAIEEYGDLPVSYSDGFEGDTDIGWVTVYDASGRTERSMKKRADFEPVEIYLH